MKILIASILITILAILVPVTAHARQLRQEHTIFIRVECIDTAIEIINGLNGYNLESSAIMGEFDRHAHFRRRVDNWAYRHVQEVLRGLGEVVSESEHSRHLAGQISDVEVRIRVLNEELERLTLMLAASRRLDIMIAINDRIALVSWERDDLLGRRNVLHTAADSPVISITLHERIEGQEIVPLTFSQRVSGRFMNSWENTVVGTGNFVVFLARTSVPMVIFGAFLCVLFLVLRKVLRKRASRIPVMSPSLMSIANADNTAAELANFPVKTDENVSLQSEITDTLSTESNQEGDEHL